MTARRRSCAPPLCRTRLGPAVEGGTGTSGDQRQIVDKRFGPPCPRQPLLARRALPDAEKHHLSRPDRSLGTIPTRRTPADQRSAIVGCGSGAACKQRRRAQLRHPHRPRFMVSRWDCGHQIEPDPTEIARRYVPTMSASRAQQQFGGGFILSTAPLAHHCGCRRCPERSHRLCQRRAEWRSGSSRANPQPRARHF